MKLTTTILKQIKNEYIKLSKNEGELRRYFVGSGAYRECFKIIVNKIPYAIKVDYDYNDEDGENVTERNIFNTIKRHHKELVPYVLPILGSFKLNKKLILVFPYCKCVGIKYRKNTDDKPRLAVIEHMIEDFHHGNVGYWENLVWCIDLNCGLDDPTHAKTLSKTHRSKFKPLYNKARKLTA